MAKELNEDTGFTISIKTMIAVGFAMATLIGIIPQVFLVVSIGSGLEIIIGQNLKPPKIMDIITSPDSAPTPSNSNITT